MEKHILLKNPELGNDSATGIHSSALLLTLGPQNPGTSRSREEPPRSGRRDPLPPCTSPGEPPGRRPTLGTDAGTPCHRPPRPLTVAPHSLLPTRGPTGLSSCPVSSRHRPQTRPPAHSPAHAPALPHAPLHAAPSYLHPHLRTPGLPSLAPHAHSARSPTHSSPLRARTFSPAHTHHILTHTRFPRLPHPPSFSTLPGRAALPLPAPAGPPSGDVSRACANGCGASRPPFPEAPGAGAGAAREQRTHAGELGPGH